MELTKVDPVCGMLVEPVGAITKEHQGQTYYFCEQVCTETFQDEPERWAQPTPRRQPSDEAAAIQTG